MSLADLYALGAPRLPEGFFYRIRIDSLGIVHVQIRRQKSKRWSALVWEISAFPRDDDATPEDTILRLCHHLVIQREERLKEIEFYGGLRRWEGDHR